MMRVPGWVIVLCAALGVIGTSGCGEPRVRMAEGPREYAPTDYEIVLDRWTRKKDLVVTSQLDNVLTATATYESWDFRWAYVVRYADDYRLTVEQRKKLLERTLEETRQQHQFFVAITGGERKYNDLTKPDGGWIVRLTDSNGNETAPEAIEAVKKPNALERTYFPYNTVFRRAFRIRFPRVNAQGKPTISPTAEWFGLRFAGARGNSELVWIVEPRNRSRTALAAP